MLLNLNMESRNLYREILSECSENVEWQERGLLMACATSKGFDEEIEIAGMANGLGIETRTLDKQALLEIEPDVKFNISGAVWYKSDAQLHPFKYLQWLKNELNTRRVRIHYKTQITELKIQNGQIKRAETDSTSLIADEFVLEAGIFSKDLVKKLGIQLPLISGKGYSIDFFDTSVHLKTPVILTEARVAITPYNNTLRLGSGMEFNGKTGQINLQRVQQCSNAPLKRSRIFQKFRPKVLKYGKDFDL